MTTPNESDSRLGKWKKIFVHELFEYFFNFAFLSFFFVSFAWYRRLLLASYHISYADYWMPMFKAVVFAKVIMIGEAVHMGRRFRKQALAVVVIYRTVLFSLLVLVFDILESVIRASLRGESPAVGLRELTSKGPYEIASSSLLVIVAFLPFFTMKEIELVFGPGKIRMLFFRKAAKVAVSDETSVEKAEV